jgi:hypothetical protein
MRSTFQLSVLLLFSPFVVWSIPSTPFNFTQRVDHFSLNQATYQQRYYQNLTNFLGPGSPIICIMGGEGAISPSTGIFYPPMVILAEQLGAAIIEPEHRFYGTSQPIPPFDTQRLELLTAPQALEDAVGGDIQLPPGQAKSLKETCLSIFSLDINNNPTDLTQLVIYQGDTDVFLNNLKLKLITKIAKLEEKECNDVAVDILSKLKDLQSLGYIIKDKHGNVLTYDAIIKGKM